MDVRKCGTLSDQMVGMLEGATSDARALRTSAWISGAFAFTLTQGTLKLGVHSATSPYGIDPTLCLGMALGLFGDLGLGALISLPFLLVGRTALARGMSALFAACSFATVAGAFHAHAVLRHLPGIASLAFLRDPGALQASLDDHASLGLLAWEVVLAVGVWLALQAWFARRLLRRRLSAKTAALGSALSFCVFLVVPFATNGQVHHGASHPLMHLVSSQKPPPAAAPAPTAPTELQALLRRVADVLTPEDLEPPADPRYPYCRKEHPRCADDHARKAGDTRPLCGKPRTPRSVILVILESVGAREAELKVGAAPVMPQLARIAREGLAFPHFYAAGDKSSQGLVGLLSGISVETHGRALAHAPLVNLPSLPRHLERAGYHTAYLHGSDLSFEQQRTYLKQLGVRTIIEPRANELEERLGWGLPDEVMFDRLASTLKAHREKQPETPLFATLFTLSTHDPYVLPKSAPTLLSDGSTYARFVNALSYLDRELGRFYDWYLAEEKPRGTLLVIVGDHAGRVPFPDDPKDTSTGEAEYRFRVPFIIAGLTPEEMSAHKDRARRVGGHLDFPQTTLGLLGIDVPHCFQGRNLLGDAWPDRRYVVSLAGENLSFFYAHDGQLRYMWALAEKRVQAFDERNDPNFRRDVYDPRTHEAQRLNAFVSAYFRLGAYLNLDNHFAPPPAKGPPRKPVIAPDKPLIASHRGRTSGDPKELGPRARDLPRDNSPEAIEAALRAGFRWLELDLQVTRDGVVILAHDPVFVGKDGREHHYSDLSVVEVRKTQPEPLTTLEDALSLIGDRAGVLLELKPQPDVFDTMRLKEGVLSALANTPRERVIVDSFSRTILATFAALSPFGVGYDLPQKPIELEWLDYAASMEFDWVYIHHKFLTPEVVREAHARGLKVMAYPVNDAAHLDALLPERVDGVITDVAAPWGLTPLSRL